MKTEIQEVRINVPKSRHGWGNFDAVVRGGKLGSIDDMKEKQSYIMPTTETMKAYIQFLQEVISEMEKD